MTKRCRSPFRMLRMVPLGDFHIFLSLNSFTRASSGVMVAHLMPTPTRYSNSSERHQLQPCLLSRQRSGRHTCGL